MTQSPEGMLASDADRDAAASALADAVASGRLSLAEHDTRLDALFAARTQDQLAAVTADLPALPVRRTALFRAVDAHRILVIGGSVQRGGRFTIGRFCSVTAAFGSLELDLRSAVPSQDEIGLTIMGLAARISITVPTGWRVNSSVLVLGASQAMADRDGPAGAPLLRVRGSCAGGVFRLAQA
jgi:hypothetical protein